MLQKSNGRYYFCLISIYCCTYLIVTTTGVQYFEPVAAGGVTNGQVNVDQATEIDRNGYIMYCPCMGRWGNQADQFLGALAFASGLNRTLVLPPWVEYLTSRPGTSIQIPFDKYIQVEPLTTYHRIISMESFMNKLAPTVWPIGKRFGFCYSFRSNNQCAMKEGNPFGPFWDHFNIDFDQHFHYGDKIAHSQLFDSFREHVREAWNQHFPGNKFSVLAFMGPPGEFPVKSSHRQLQKYVKWSKYVSDQAEQFINNMMNNQPFNAIHLRMGSDWKNACDYIKEHPTKNYMESPQCYGDNNSKPISYEVCYPSEKEILKLTKRMINAYDVKYVFVATDNASVRAKLVNKLKKIKIVYLDVANPQVELAIIGKAEHAIVNCVSSFSGFAKRERDAANKPTAFWSFKS